MIYFTADFHFGHTNIINYCNRPFKDVLEMNTTLINNFNGVVKPKDLTYILGDICIRQIDTDYYLNKLNGEKKIIKGTHDKKLDAPNLIEIKLDNISVVLCHYSMRTWSKKHYGSYHLYGHSHGTMPFSYDLSYDVGVDNNNFFPVSWLEIKEIMGNRVEFYGNKRLGIII